MHHRRTQSYDGLMRAAILHLASLLLLASPALAVPADPPTAPVKPVGKPMKGPMTQADMKVIADPAGLDFGIVAPHTVLEGDFTLVNTTDKPLTVQQAVPSCQCTTIEIVGKQIPARGTLQVPVTMKVSSTGIKTSNVKVIVQDQPRPITLELRAEVAYAVRVTIADAKGQMQPYVDAAEDVTRLKGVATVSSVDGKPFRVLSVQGKPPVFATGAGDAAQASQQIAFDLPGAPCEQVPKYLLIETDRPDARLIDARVRHECARITPGIDIAEFRSNAGVITPGDSAQFDIEVKKMDQNRIGSVTCADPRFTATLVGQKADGKSVLATIKLQPNAEVRGVFIVPVRLTAIDAQGRPFMTQRPEPPKPGQPTRMMTLPAEADLLVYGKVE